MLPVCRSFLFSVMILQHRIYPYGDCSRKTKGRGFPPTKAQPVTAALKGEEINEGNNAIEKAKNNTMGPPRKEAFLRSFSSVP